jgi:hypothetical protein
MTEEVSGWSLQLVVQRDAKAIPIAVIMGAKRSDDGELETRSIKEEVGLRFEVWEIRLSHAAVIAVA